MNPEAEQPDNAVPAAAAPAAARTAPKRKAGVPVWRTGKPDAFLAAAVDTARNAIEGITAAADIGPHIGARSEGDRLVTHLFESRLAGYAGWQWFAVLTRNSRSKVVTVSELGLLPSEDSILAPEWVPWAERVRPEDAQQQDEQEREAGDNNAGDEDAAEPAAAENGPSGQESVETGSGDPEEPAEPSHGQPEPAEPQLGGDRSAGQNAQSPAAD